MVFPSHEVHLPRAATAHPPRPTGSEGSHVTSFLPVELCSSVFIQETAKQRLASHCVLNFDEFKPEWTSEKPSADHF
jgi:hypothetical protein